MSTATERVQAGIAFLDASPLIPSDWREHVRPDDLSIVSPQACLLAQLARAYEWQPEDGWYVTPYDAALQHLGWDRHGTFDEQLKANGFLHDYNSDPQDGTTVTEAWREALSTTPAV